MIWPPKNYGFGNYSQWAGASWTRRAAIPLMINSQLTPERQQVWEFFNGRHEGFFLDVGANEPKKGSQTWFLEEQGWRGILVEPQARPPKSCGLSVLNRESFRLLVEHQDILRNDPAHR